MNEEQEQRRQEEGRRRDTGGGMKPAGGVLSPSPRKHPALQDFRKKKKRKKLRKVGSNYPYFVAGPKNNLLRRCRKKDRFINANRRASTS